MRPRTRTAAVLGALALLNGLAQRTRLPGDLVIPLGAAALLVGARASGLSWAELGLGRDAVRASLPAAAAAAALTGATITGVAALPASTAYRSDLRYPDRRAAARAALLTIPLAVAIPEEVMFRGVLDASLHRQVSPRAATAVGALAFGAWHVLGATTLTHDNEGIGSALGTGLRGRVAAAAGASTMTTAAGLGFLMLRRRSDCVLPGIGVHWALNSGAALAAAGVLARRKVYRLVADL